MCYWEDKADVWIENNIKLRRKTNESVQEKTKIQKKTCDL